MGLAFPGKRFGVLWRNADMKEAIGNSGGWLYGSQAFRPTNLKSARTSPPPVVEKEVHQLMVRESGLNSENTETKEKPEWQIRREQEMARLDREAELNRQREAQLQPKKIFKPSVFVGRSED